MSEEQERPLPIRRVRVVRPGGGGGSSSASPERYSQYRYPPRPPARDLRPYLVGGIVSAAVTTLLIIVWLLATPNNSFNGAPTGTPLPAANGVNPLDVPTQIEP